jgi:hypothetical protein
MNKLSTMLFACLLLSSISGMNKKAAINTYEKIHSMLTKETNSVFDSEIKLNYLKQGILTHGLIQNSMKQIRGNYNITEGTNVIGMSIFNNISTLPFNMDKNQSSVKQEETYEYETNIQCSNLNCVYPYGSCIDFTTCQCANEYSSYKLENIPATLYCTYERKKQLISFLLEFFLPFGVGHFYSGRPLMGILKLLAMLSPCLFVSFLLCCKESGSIISILVTGIGCLYGIWQLIDIILFSINIYRDGNGVPLMHW